jgi:SAM-dependent methyltransferase
MIDLWRQHELVQREACPVCGLSVDSPALGYRSDLLGMKRCSGCSTLLVDPVPNEEALKRCYGEGYFDGRDGDHGVGSNARDYFVDGAGVAAREHAEVVRRLPLRGKTVLEVGCATGALLHRLQNEGPSRCVGIDISQAAIDYGKKHYGLELRCSTFEDAGFSNAEFDLILMLDVIEHVPRPQQFFGEAVRCLKDGGAIFLRTPNADSYRVTGDQWNYTFCGLEHIQYLSRGTMEWLARRYGMVLSEFWTEGCPSCLPYARFHPSRLVRLVREPRTILTNAMRRWRGRGLPGQGMGLDFFAVLQKPLQ